MIVLSSSAFIQQIKDGGARDQGLENTLNYSGLLNALPWFFSAAGLFVVGILFFLKKLKKFKFSVPLIALIVFCFTSAFWADKPTVVIRSAVLISTAYLLIGAQVALYGEKNTMRFFGFAVFIILFCSIFAVLLIPSYGLSVGFEHEGKWQGVFDHKNGLGNFSAIAFLIFIWNYKQKKSKIKLISALLAATLVIGSQSGTALANIVIVTFVYAFLSFELPRKLAYKLRYLIIAFLIALSLFAIFIAVGFQEFSIFEKDSSFTGRNMIWGYILAKIEASPWIGYGLDQLTASTIKNSAEFFTNVGFLVNSSHNGFLETAFSLGLVGFILILWVFMNQLGRVKNGANFTLLFGYLISFLVINTFEARMVSFNFYLVGLMYIIAVTNDPTNLATSKIRAKFISNENLETHMAMTDKV